MSSPPPAQLAAASLPAPSPLLPRSDNSKNDAVLSGAAFLRRAASAGLVSVVVKSSSQAPPPLLLPRAPSASSVFSSSSSLAGGAPQVSALLPIAGLPAPSGLVRALSGVQGLPPQVELR